MAPSGHAQYGGGGVKASCRRTTWLHGKPLTRTDLFLVTGFWNSREEARHSGQCTAQLHHPRSQATTCFRPPFYLTYEYGVPHEGAHEALRHPHGPHHQRLVGGDGRQHSLTPLRVCGDAGRSGSDVKTIPET